MIVEIEGYSDIDNDKYQQFLDLRSAIYVKDLKYDKFAEFDGLDKKSCYYLLTVSGKYVGVVRYTTDDDKIIIDRFGILKEFRKQSFGSLLIRFVINELLPSKKQIFIISSEKLVSYFNIFGFKKNNTKTNIGKKELNLLKLE